MNKRIITIIYIFTIGLVLLSLLISIIFAKIYALRGIAVVFVPLIWVITFYILKINENLKKRVLYLIISVVISVLAIFGIFLIIKITSPFPDTNEKFFQTCLSAQYSLGCQNCKSYSDDITIGEDSSPWDYESENPDAQLCIICEMAWNEFGNYGNLPPNDCLDPNSPLRKLN